MKNIQHLKIVKLNSLFLWLADVHIKNIPEIFIAWMQNLLLCSLVGEGIVFVKEKLRPMPAPRLNQILT